MQVKGVDFLLTFKCPAKCKHCSYKASPNRTGQVKVEIAEGYLKNLTETQPLEAFAIHGGEPFIYFGDMKQILEKAKEADVPQRWVITNGFWAKTKTIASKKLRDLKEAGLTHIVFSVDGFHQEFIPLKNVKIGIETAKCIGFERVVVDSYFIGHLNTDNLYNNATKKALEIIKTIEGVEIKRYRARFEGRAAEFLTKYIELKTEIPTGSCQLPSWIGGDLKNPEGIEIDYEGNVTLCPGICIGNTNTQPLIQIIQSYDYREHPILAPLAQEGPKALFKTARTNGFQQQKFVDECHLCFEARKYLQPYYPRYLAPKGCYF
ncbi:MAG: radical SAM/SPASM domain-containing protein [Candidatus Heimdallarchaeota archaeon]